MGKVVKAINPSKRLILGHLPFVGISYQSDKKDEEYCKRFSKMSATKKVVEAAIKMGVSRFAAASPRSSSLSPVHLEVLRLMIGEGHEIEILPCIEIPIKLGDTSVDAFRRWATYANLEGKLYSDVKQRMVNDPILNFREGWKHRLPVSESYREEDFQKLIINWNQINEDLEFFSDLPVRYIELGSETDFLVMTGRFDLLGQLVDTVKKHGFKMVLLGVHHAGVTIPMLNEKLGGFNGYVTPLNPLGVMMFPTKLSAETAVRSAGKPVYAIKPLAGGRVSPKKAFAYVFNFDVEGCMFGVGSIAELKEDFEAAMEVLDEANSKQVD